MEREAEKSAGVESADMPGKKGSSEVSAQGVAEIDRTVKVRWPVEGQGFSLTADRVKEVFSKFGKIESADLLNTKMLRLSGSKKKQPAVVCMIQYSSVVGAHAAVDTFDARQWAQGL